MNLVRAICVIGLLFLFTVLPVLAQDTVTGAFEGTVTNSQTGDPVIGATAEISNLETGLLFTKQTDARGRFYQGLLAPGLYRIRVAAQGFQTQEVVQRLNIARTGEVVPVPVSLDPAAPGAVISTLPTVTVPTTPPAPGATPSVPPPTAPPAAPSAFSEIRGAINTTDASRTGSFNETQVSVLPLGASTFTRSFDELALLLPGVAPPPQTLGSVAGPGQGAGVGTAGQFAVNGLRSRANNFTVDGSDNNDEDIGVRRQGFTALIPQPIESIREYQAITLLAPAQFGRNLGAVVNAVSKSGGNDVRGALYGLFNSSHLNARNPFDTTNGTATTAFTAGNNQPVLLRQLANGVNRDTPLNLTNQSAGEDSFTLGKFGVVLGGPVTRQKTFYFFSFEQQILNAAREENFAVPTVEQRGAFGSGATALTQNPFDGTATRAYPTNSGGDAFFSLFPFANNPTGVYGTNTYTQVLPASGRGSVASGKLDHNFKVAGRAQSVTGRYNFTDDWRELSKTGEALFSTLRPEVRTQNFSFFLNSQLNANGAAHEGFNQVRLSYGRTRLRFHEVRPCVASAAAYSNDCLLPSDGFRGTEFLLNRPLFGNATLPPAAGQPNRGAVIYERIVDENGAPLNTEFATGPLGQVYIAGFSPLGVDVYNFPQRRVNNTYQAADVLTLRSGDHSFAFGADTRRSELNSDLQRLFRPLITFNGTPRLDASATGPFRTLPAGARTPFIRPEDLAAVGAASNVFLTLASRTDANINLRFYQLNFFAQDHWRVRPDLTVAYGLRYEYNTPARETQGLIERTFNAPQRALTPSLQRFTAGRTSIYDPDRDNFAPRLSVAYAPQWFGRQRPSVLRAGVGVFYDQILGAVVSQSRSVYPDFLPVNFSGLYAQLGARDLGFTNPTTLRLAQGQQIVRLVRANTLNQADVALTPSFVNFITSAFPNALGETLPSRRLKMPMALHYSLAYEQQLNAGLMLSFAYVGTQGRHLLRFTTPNLGPGVNAIPVGFRAEDDSPLLSGRICTPSVTGLCAGRPATDIGAVSIFESAANSRYDALQIELRTRLATGLQAQAAYTFGSARDEVSDVFELAGAFALPQNSLDLKAERGAANFDLRHRATFSLVYDFPNERGWLRGTRLSSIGRFHSGPPFTVNSVFDVNLDGNLTDRLNTTDGLSATGAGRQPLLLQTSSPFSLLGAPGQSGRVARNAFRAGGLTEVDLSVSKALPFAATRALSLRADFFNLLNRANYGIPVRLLEAPGFGRAVNTVTPSFRLQLGVKLEF